MRTGDDQVTRGTTPYISSIPKWVKLRKLKDVMVEFKKLYIAQAQQTYHHSKPKVNAERMQAKAAALACMELIQKQFDTDPNDRLQCIVLGAAHHPKCHPKTYKITTPQNRMNGLIIFKSGKPLLALGIGECLGPRIQTDHSKYVVPQPHAGPETAWRGKPFYLAGAEKKPGGDKQFGSLIELSNQSGAKMNCRISVVAERLSRTIPLKLNNTRLDHALAQLLPDYSLEQIRTWIKSDYVRVNSLKVRANLRVGEDDRVCISGALRETLEITFVDPDDREIFTQDAFASLPIQHQPLARSTGRHVYREDINRLRGMPSPYTRLKTQYKATQLLRGPGFNGAKMAARITRLRQSFTEDIFNSKYKGFLAAMQSKMKPNKALDKAIRETSVLRAATLSLKQHHDVAPTPTARPRSNTRGQWAAPAAAPAVTQEADEEANTQSKRRCTIG